VHAAPATNGGAVVVGGPWGGDPVSETVPASGLTLVFNTYRQNLLNGPAPSTGGHWRRKFESKAPLI
jgi:hypothetical protein